MEGKSQGSIIFLTIAVTLSYLFHDFFVTNESPVITISSGKVQGIVSKARNGELYYEFLGIPYGQPPMGALRFESPLPAKPWEGIMKTNELGPECMQLEVMVTGRLLGSEDCLRLNVYTPKIFSSGLLPVMVFIHGGLFMAGSSNMYRAKYFMETQDVILVTLNYRIGSLGFLNTNDGVVKGNMGLKDQRLALEWVQKNIQEFGGDPSKVTLFGESAGGASVHYHILSPSSKGLFQRALSQSGTSLKPWALNKDPARQAYLYGKKFNCPSNSSHALVSCLKKIDAERLVLASLGVMSPIKKSEDTFGPTVELVTDKDAFLTENPLSIAKSGKFSKVPWMLGVNKGEGLFNLGRLLADSETQVLSRLDEDWNTLAPILLSYNSEDKKASEEIKAYYFGSSIRNPINSINNLTELFSDRNFFYATHTASMHHASQSPVYLYYLSYQGDISLYKLMKWVSPISWINVEIQVVLSIIKELFYKYALGYTEQNLGPSHADELVLLFNMHYFAEVFQSSRDYEMSKSLIKLWTSFAKEENLKYRGIRWDPISSNQTILKYLQIDQTSRMIDEPFYSRMRFWENLNIQD